jgi:hypothetical protein
MPVPAEHRVEKCVSAIWGYSRGLRFGLGSIQPFHASNIFLSRPGVGRRFCLLNLFGNQMPQPASGSLNSSSMAMDLS